LVRNPGWCALFTHTKALEWGRPHSNAFVCVNSAHQPGFLTNGRVYRESGQWDTALHRRFQ